MRAEFGDECLVWNGRRMPAGYGTVNLGKKNYFLHRLMYHIFVGPIPDRMMLHHKCRNKSCFNPKHLQVCTNLENQIFDDTLIAHNANKTHCKRGHPFEGENLRQWYVDGRRQRDCRACKKIRYKEMCQRKKQKELQDVK